MFKLKAFIVVFLFSAIITLPLLANKQIATIAVDTSNHSPYKINREMWSGFIEYARDWMNGPYGYYAQEIRNRGFDYMAWDFTYLSYYWAVRVDKSIGNGWGVGIIDGGYNKNGTK